MASWKTLIRQIRHQLKPPPFTGDYYKAEMEAREAIQEAAASGDESDLRAAMGSISGLRRRWARILIVSITAAVFEQRDTSRQSIREWQQRVLGQSISSNHLKLYGKEGRSGGGRANYLEPASNVNSMAQKIFVQYKEALKKL